jgi:zinc transporter ZupT
MGQSIFNILIFGVVAALAPLLGGAILLSPKINYRNERYLKYFVALGAGFLLGAIFMEILPETISLWTDRDIAQKSLVFPMALLLGGYLMLQFFEHTLAPHFHFGEETHPESFLKPSAIYAAIGGLTIHALFDGVSIAAASLASAKVGLMVFIAILLHKMPEGFTVASITLASGRTKQIAFLATLLVGTATFLGVLSVVLLNVKINSIVAYALPFSAGVTLYVAASDLIPEVNHGHQKSPAVSISVFVGVAIFYLLHHLIER